MAEKHTCMLFWFVDEGEVRVLLSKRGLSSYEGSIIAKQQSFAGGMQIFPGGKVEKNESLLAAAWRELCEEAGFSAWYYIQKIIRQEPRRVENRDDFFAIKLSEEEKEIFTSKIQLSPENESFCWYLVEEVSKFEDLKLYKKGVPEGILAMFPDEVRFIMKLANDQLLT